VCGVPIDTPVELRFDRFLLPTSAVRQSITYYTGLARTPPVLDSRLPELIPSYDPFERVVRFTLPEGATLEPNTLYTVELFVAGKPATPPRDVPAIGWGFRAFDGAPLDEQGLLRISFRTGEHRAAVTPPAVPTCDEVVSLFRCEGLGCDTGYAGCASCHLGDGHAPYGLVLTSRDALRETAVGQVAHQTETGPTTGVPLEAADRFGSGMPIIDPFRPENSYLLYKVLVGTSAYAPSLGEEEECRSAYSVGLSATSVGPDCLAPATEELERIRSWFVLGEAMPPAHVPAFLHRAEVRQLVEFIRAGARCR
jgi:hypothetical protein